LASNLLKQKLRNHELICGVWLAWLDPNLIEFYGHLGFDYIIIDAEHLAVDKSTCQQLVRAADLVGMTSIVRVPDRSAPTILGFLDLGAWGIYAPHVQTAADAEAVVQAVKYAPQGHRSMNYPRPMKYGITDSPVDMYAQANEDTIVIVLVEEPAGLRNLDSILTVKDVDVVGIGDGDLSHALGFVGNKLHPELRRVVDEAESKVAASGKILDAVVHTAEDAIASIARGVTMISLSDRVVLEEFGHRFLNEVRAHKRQTVRR
jgi:2-keto-3-deoxy-L-rhamnonate aldolase RhmA